MTWNYRVIRRIREDGEAIFSIEEVYYAEDGHIEGWTQSEKVWGISEKELRNVMTWMAEAFSKPSLDEMALEALVQNSVDEPDLPEVEPRMTIDEVLDSLGLERTDVDLPRTAVFETPLTIDEEVPESLGFPDAEGPNVGRMPDVPANEPLTEEDFQ